MFSTRGAETIRYLENNTIWGFKIMKLDCKTNYVFGKISVSFKVNYLFLILNQCLCKFV